MTEIDTCVAIEIDVFYLPRFALGIEQLFELFIALKKAIKASAESPTLVVTPKKKTQLINQLRFSNYIKIILLLLCACKHVFAVHTSDVF